MNPSDAVPDSEKRLPSDGSEASDRVVRADDADDAVHRLVSACFTAESWQAETVLRSLASICGGPDAEKVRLDKVRMLDWSLKRDLVSVLIAVGTPGFSEAKIY